MSHSHTAKMMSIIKDCRFQCYRARPYTLLVRKAKWTSLQSSYCVVKTRLWWSIG